MKSESRTEVPKKEPVKIEGKYVDRELSWLAFNNRVLYCASDKGLYLNERLNFLGITSSNLDEFISIRYPRAIAEENPEAKKILNEIKNSLEAQVDIFKDIKKEMEAANLKVSKIRDLDKKERATVKKIFANIIFPVLTPISLGSTNEIPTFKNGQAVVAAIVKQGQVENLTFVPIDKHLTAAYKIGNKLVMIEDIVMHCIGKFFVNKEISCCGHFRIIKDESVFFNGNETTYFLDRMRDTVDKRTTSEPLFLEFQKDFPKRLRHIICNVLNIENRHSFEGGEVLDYSRFSKQRYLSERYSYPDFTPVPYNAIEEKSNIFQTLQEKDIILQHPYDSYDMVVKFIEHAAVDPKVIAIKQTLYRVSSEDSPIIDALCIAARKGKNVCLLIELKARNDEAQNIEILDKLKRAGVNFVFGKEWLKTHCKLCLVVRAEKKGSIVYSHVGTGNYNEKTSKIYTDISYFTSRQKVGGDLINIFNILSGVSSPDEKLQKVFYAPTNLRKKIIKNIDREIGYAKKGKKAEVFLKLNSINDPEIINKLYEAADKGVEVYIICRGICSLVAKKNLYVKSIVGRFLEHSRIYYFRNDDKPEYYIASADLLTRNLDRRIEILLNINTQECTRKLANIIKVFKEDRANSFRMDDDGSYKKLKGEFDCHQWFVDNADMTEKKVKFAKRDKK